MKLTICVDFYIRMSFSASAILKNRPPCLIFEFLVSIFGFSMVYYIGPDLKIIQIGLILTLLEQNLFFVAAILKKMAAILFFHVANVLF